MNWFWISVSLYILGALLVPSITKSRKPWYAVLTVMILWPLISFFAFSLAQSLNMSCWVLGADGFKKRGAK